MEFVEWLSLGNDSGWVGCEEGGDVQIEVSARDGLLVAGACSRPPGRDGACRKLVEGHRESICFLAADDDDNRNSNDGSRLSQRVWSLLLWNRPNHR